MSGEGMNSAWFDALENEERRGLPGLADRRHHLVSHLPAPGRPHLVFRARRCAPVAAAAAAGRTLAGAAIPAGRCRAAAPRHGPQGRHHQRMARRLRGRRGCSIGAGLKTPIAARLARIIARRSIGAGAFRRRRARLRPYRRHPRAARGGPAARRHRRHLDGRDHRRLRGDGLGRQRDRDSASARRSSRAIRLAIMCCPSSAWCAAGASKTGCRSISARP